MDVPITQRELDLLLRGLRDLLARMTEAGAAAAAIKEVRHLIKKMDQIGKPPPETSYRS